MLNTELDSFILKFKQLCQAGLDAHLAVDSQAGKVWVHLHVPLGQALGPSQEEQPTKIRKNRNGPSRQRRRARRKAAVGVSWLTIFKVSIFVKVMIDMFQI